MAKTRKKPTFKQVQLHRLETSVHRLKNLLSLNAPDTILQNEIGMIIKKAFYCFGSGIFDWAFNEQLAEQKRQHGFCTICSEPRLESEPEFCSNCKNKLGKSGKD